MAKLVTEKQWQFYDEYGYVVLGKVASDGQHEALCRRIDQIMLGTAKVNYDKMLMQVDSDNGKYHELNEQTWGHKGSHLNYRKIQDLEFDPLFLRYMQNPLFEDVCAHVYGPETVISCNRAMFMNKPAQRGTRLVWHQDLWSKTFATPPLLTVYTALDTATRDNGCVQIIPGSHKRGMINPEHGAGFLLDEDLVAKHCPQEQVHHLELKAGEVTLLHNLMLHSSGINKTDTPRRAFSVNYMDADTRSPEGVPTNFSIIFGSGSLVPEHLEAAVT